jgi:outer membrane protein OmpA-like peptidoglycan-associated protein
MKHIYKGLYMKKFTLFLWLILLSSAINSLADQASETERLPLRIGGFIDLNGNFHTTDFRALPGVPNCCPKFESGTGMGIAIGALMDIPIDDKIFIELRADYSQHNGTLKRTESTSIGIDGAEALGEFEHKITATLSSAGLTAMFAYSPIKRLSLFAGPRIGFTLQKSYEQSETLVSPSDRGYFLGTDSSRVRNVSSGEIQDAQSINFGVELGARYEFPLNRSGNLFIAPELFFRIGMSQVVKDLTWSVHTLHGGISIVYNLPAPEPRKPEPIPVVVAAPIVAPKVEPQPKADIAIEKKEDKPKLTAKISAVGYDDQKEKPELKVHVEEFLSISMRPLLTYVFFEDNSSEIPGRYKQISKQKAEAFNVNSLYNVSTLPTYYNILNIVGARLRDNKKSKIRLVGCNSNTGEEKGNTELSRNRAGAVANYLESVWGIDESRITISSRNLPATPSRADVPDGIEENRRVEIYSDLSDITAPVITNDTLRQVSPKGIRFYPQVTAEKGIANWRIVAKQKGRILKDISGSGFAPDAIDWPINNEKESIPQTAKDIEYYLEVTDNSGQTVRTDASALTVEQKTVLQKSQKLIADKRIDHYSIILFDFDKPSLNSEQTKQVRFIKDKIERNSKVTITGYTDRMGDEEHNRVLALERAKSMARTLSASNSEILGAGRDPELYDNSMPEGRFYCRTVEVIVETPIAE